MNPCRFCEIINEPRKANEEVVFENEHFIVLLDKYRQTSIGGICLMIPRIYDILRRIFKLNKSALNSERIFEYAEKIRIQINTN
jgi:diadenosine tetraphosphate (Ap4A) HIT family hydrolase